ncbi:hypothetical protein TNCV_1757541 [Trichonephila clavipes]|nr:hypothetical protein TNCV_1757541 [Trichonephila clavipes]
MKCRSSDTKIYPPMGKKSKRYRDLHYSNWQVSLSFAPWDKEDIVFDVVVVVGIIGHAGKGVNIDTVDEEDAAEVYKLLDVVGAISFKGIGGRDLEDDVTVK